jgi:hypothetical protein
MKACVIAKSISFELSAPFSLWVCIFFVVLRYVSVRDIDRAFALKNC